MAIEITAEMRAAFLANTDDTCGQVGCSRDDCLDVRLAAVLAIVERDYVVGPKGAAPGPFDIVVRERCEECDDLIEWHDRKGCQGDFGHCPCSVRMTQVRP